MEINECQSCWEDPELKKIYRNKYYQEKLKDVYKVKIPCSICDKKINLSSYQRHILSNFHKNNKLRKTNDNALEILAHQKIQKYLT